MCPGPPAFLDAPRASCLAALHALDLHGRVESCVCCSCRGWHLLAPLQERWWHRSQLLRVALKLNWNSLCSCHSNCKGEEMYYPPPNCSTGQLLKCRICTSMDLKLCKSLCKTPCPGCTNHRRRHYRFSINLHFSSNSLLSSQWNRSRVLGAIQSLKMTSNLHQKAYTGDLQVTSKGKPVSSSHQQMANQNCE